MSENSNPVGLNDILADSLSSSQAKAEKVTMSDNMQFTLDSDKVLRATVEALLAHNPSWTGLLSFLGDDPKPLAIDYSSITREVSA